MKKTVYIALCVLLGVVLMLIIQRGLLALYIILTDTYLSYDLLTDSQLQIINWGSILFAVIFGLLYGNFLGHHWYPRVYSSTGERVPRTSESDLATPIPAPQQKTVTIKPVRVQSTRVSLKSETRDKGWDFDDLISHDIPAVESMSNAAPAIASAVSLGEKPPVKPVKKVAVKKKIVAKPKTAKKTKPATKSKV